MINFNSMPSKYWDDATKISYLQRRIIVYSIMYYDLNISCISDREYDELSHQLVRMQNTANPKEFKRSTYYYAMYDFDGSTGFNLYDRLNDKDKKWLREIAIMVSKLHNGKSHD